MGYKISGGKCIWLLNVLDEDRTTIGIEYYDLQNHNVMQVSTCYHFSVFCLISPNYKKPFFRMLFETFGESIHMICDSNLRLESYPNNLLDCLLQVNHSERLIQYDLIVIKCISLKVSICIREFLKSNLKPYYQCVDSLDTSYILMMHLFLDSNTIEYEHKSMDKATIPLRLKFLQSKIPPECYRNNDHSMKKAFSYFDPTRIFASNGFYIFNLDTLRLTLFSSNTADLYKLLPMIAFHLETMTDNMVDVPTGCSEHEQIISYILIATHMEQAIICVNYLRFLSREQQEIFGKENPENNTGSDEWWKERDKQLSDKYQRQFLQNFQELHVWVESYDSEIHLLESFVQLYSQGQLLQALVNNSKAKHFFTGHNIIKYGMPFVLRRFKWHQMHQCVEEHVTFDVHSLGTESIIIKFHKHSYLIDSHRIFQEHLTTNLMDLPNDDTANPITVRIYYILGITLQYNRDDKILQFLQQIAKKAMTINSTSGQMSPNISLHELPRTIHNCLTHQNINIPNLQIYPFDNFLTQNIQSCKSVLNLWENFCYPKLFSLITQVYPCNLEKALQANVETRIKIAFNYIAIKYRQIWSANNFTTEPKKFRYLFHYRLQESLIYRTTKIFHQENDDFTQCEIYPNYCINQDERIEIDDSRYRKNFHQFFHEICTQHPVVDQVEYKSKKKKYAGEVIVFPGVYNNCIRIDIISQYPNILIGKDIFTDAVDICSAGSLQKILTIDSTLRENFSSWMNADCIQVYAEERQRGNFASLRDFSFSDSNPAGQVVGQLVINIEVLMQLPFEIPLIIYCPDSRSFLTNFLQQLLKVRKCLQGEISTLVQDKENPSLQTATQEFVQITINSVYKLMENIQIPITAITTMFSRKILMFTSKILPVIILELLFQHLKIWNWFYSKHQIDLLQNLETFNDDIMEDNFNPIQVHIVGSLISTKGREKFTRTCKLILEYFSITSFDTICENTSTNEMRITHQILNETNIRLLRLRCLIDGQTSVRNLSDTREQLKNLLNEIGDQNSNYIQEIFNNLPLAIKNCVFVSDTNGLQFLNKFQLDGKLIIELLNNEIGKVFELDNIILSKKECAFVFALSNKKYTIFDLNPLEKVTFLKNQYVIYIDDCKVQHVGYQAALPFFKYLCNFIAQICLLIHEGKTLRVYKFGEIIWSVFNYLESLPPGQIYVRVKLNRYKIDSGRRRFSEKYKETNNGILRAVYIVNGSTVTKQSLNNNPFTLSNSKNHLNQIILLDDYIWSVQHQQNVGNSNNLQLHYGFFLRNFGKIWYKQYCQATNNMDDEIKSGSNLKELGGTASIIDQYFDDWLSQSTQSRSVDDLDSFLLNRFIVVNESSLSESLSSSVEMDT